MKISAIISEYNPMHLGHIYQIKKTQEKTKCDAIIAVMSGNFVQRGLPSIIDKWERTKTALNSGIDLVIELPVVYCLSSAETFAYGAVSLLNSLKIVNCLSFGTEEGNITSISEIADNLSNENDQFKSKLRQYLEKGYSYPKSRSKAYCETFNNNSEIFLLPNNILGVEYVKNLHILNSTILPYTIKRMGNQYNDESLKHSYASSSAIRKYIKSDEDIDKLKPYLSSYQYKSILNLQNSKYDFAFDKKIFEYIKYKYTVIGKSLESIPDTNEGLYNRIEKAILKSSSFDDIINFSKSKRYTYARISRILMSYFIGFDNFDIINLKKKPCPYARILGFNEKGQEILKMMKKTSEIPLINKIPKTMDQTLSLDILSTKAYSMINRNVSEDSDYHIRPIRI